MARAMHAEPSIGGRVLGSAGMPRMFRRERSGGERPRRNGWVTAAVSASALPWGVWAVARVTGIEAGFPAVALMAFTPYAAATSIVPLAFALLMRRGWAALAAGAAAAALLACVLPRGLPGPAPQTVPNGSRLTVLSANVYYGLADADALVRLVRERGVDVLSLQELTPQADDALARAGLGALLPHDVTHAGTGPIGGAIYSAYPLEEVGEMERTPYFAMPRARVRISGAAPLEIVSAHAMPPYGAEAFPEWADSLRQLPDARPDGRLRVIAGDFNATLDHAELRGLLATGYTDAADAAGTGWHPTWSAGGSLPGVTIDHILVDRRVEVHRTSTHRLPGTDHRAVLAELTLPGA